MKKLKFLALSVILVAGLAFVACNDKKDEKKSDDGKKTEETTNEDEVTKDEEASTGGAWSEFERTQFLKSCVESFNQSSGGLDGEKYCSCMLEKIEIEYPNYMDAQNISQAEMNEWAVDCLK